MDKTASKFSRRLMALLATLPKEKAGPLIDKLVPNTTFWRPRDPRALELMFLIKQKRDLYDVNQARTLPHFPGGEPLWKWPFATRSKVHTNRVDRYHAGPGYARTESVRQNMSTAGHQPPDSVASRIADPLLEKWTPSYLNSKPSLISGYARPDKTTRRAPDPHKVAERYRRLHEAIPLRRTRIIRALLKASVNDPAVKAGRGVRWRGAAVKDSPTAQALGDRPTPSVWKGVPERELSQKLDEPITNMFGTAYPDVAAGYASKENKTKGLVFRLRGTDSKDLLWTPHLARQDPQERIRRLEEVRKGIDKLQGRADWRTRHRYETVVPGQTDLTRVPVYRQEGDDLVKLAPSIRHLPGWVELVSPKNYPPAFNPQLDLELRRRIRWMLKRMRGKSGKELGQLAENAWES